MASTNKTTNYQLSQYIGTDKPTYLVDYNADMRKIDTGIHNAKTEADTNTSHIGTMESLETQDKDDLVSAINEVKTVADNGDSNATLALNEIGNLDNLNTSAKDKLVNAINETLTTANQGVTDASSAQGSANNALSFIGTLASLLTEHKDNLVNAINDNYSSIANLVATGTTGHGTYLRFSNGIQICFKSQTKSITLSKGVQVMLDGTAETAENLPAEFSENPCVFTSVGNLISNPKYNASPKTTYPDIAVHSPYSSGSSTSNYQVFILVIGKWK